MPKEKLMIIDGNALLHRAFHALPPLATKEGVLVNAVYGFTTVLMKALKEIKPECVAVAFDVAGGTFRDEMYKEYKAGRQKQPDELYAQIPMIKEVVDAFGIVVVEKKGFEADDIIATLSKRSKDKETIIVTGDKDAFQLIDENTKVYGFRKGMSDIVIYDIEEVKNRYGIEPKQMIDLKALAGDPSDNIPGVRGIGEKTAIDLLQKYKTVEGVYKNIENDDIKPRIRDLLKQGKKDAELGKELVTLNNNVELDIEVFDCKMNKPDYEKLKDIFEKFQFRGLVKRIAGMDESKEDKKDKGQTLFGSSTEKLKELPEKGHDFKILMHEIGDNQFSISKDSFDIKIAAHLLSVGDKDYTLESIAKHYNIKEEKNIIDVLANKMTADLKKEKMWDLFQDVEMPLISVLYKMEKEGIKIDIKYLQKLSLEFQTILSKLTKDIYRYAGKEFNIKSPLQLREILFDELKLIPEAGRIKKTAKGGARSTAASELEKLKGAHPIIDLIFEYREIAKLESTYTHTLIDLADKKNSRIHTTFNQTVTATGRLSSSEPNLQNIPIRTEKGRMIRKAFVAEKGCELIAADYSQIELRAAASLSGDTKMIKAFQSGQDFHKTTAAEVFGVKFEKVTPEQRRNAKAINFGIIYGMGATALAQSTGISRSEASEFIDRYFEVFNILSDYLEELKDFAREKGYVETLFGRRRYINDIDSGVQQVRAAAERMAVNMPLQGTAADLMKMAMIKVSKHFENNKDVRVLLQVHDELVIEVKSNLVPKVSKEVKEIMENVYKLKVPIEVEVKSGINWGEME